MIMKIKGVSCGNVEETEWVVYAESIRTLRSFKDNVGARICQVYLGMPEGWVTVQQSQYEELVKQMEGTNGHE